MATMSFLIEEMLHFSKGLKMNLCLASVVYNLRQRNVEKAVLFEFELVLVVMGGSNARK